MHTMFRLWLFPVWAVLLFPACKSKQQTIKPTEEKITASVYASGVLKSKNQYQVFSAVNGIAGEVLVSEGDLVKKGDPLIRLTNTTAQLNTENAGIAADYASRAANSDKLIDLRNNIELARAKKDNDASLLERQKNLWNQQIGSRNEVEQRELAYKNSSMAYESAKLRYNELQKQISFQEKQARKSLDISRVTSSDYTIKSAVTGKVYSILKSKGEMVNIQNPVAIVGDENAFIVELQVDEYDIVRIQPEQKVFINMDSYKGQVFEARVNKINPLMNERTKTFTVEARFTQPPAHLYPNLTCEANIVISVKDKALTIPANCLVDNSYVLLPNKEKRKVTVGLRDMQKVEILSGLTVNDLIIKPAP